MTDNLHRHAENVLRDHLKVTSCQSNLQSTAYLLKCPSSLSVLPPVPDNTNADRGHHREIVLREESPAEDLRAALHVGAATDHHHPTGGGLQHTQTQHTNIVSAAISVQSFT